MALLHYGIENLQITKPSEVDIPDIYRVFEESISDAFVKDGIESMQEDMQSEIEHKKHLLISAMDNSELSLRTRPYFLIAKLEGIAVGTISIGSCGEEIQKCTHNQFDEIPELGSLYVLPDVQEKGVGSALIQAMISTLHEQGIEEFCLDSGYKRAQQRWLRKFGKPYLIVKNYWGVDMDHYIWLCKVSEYR